MLRSCVTTYARLRCRQNDEAKPNSRGDGAMAPPPRTENKAALETVFLNEVSLVFIRPLPDVSAAGWMKPIAFLMHINAALLRFIIHK
jgi:hypothetical protein